jgi:hypothetical protein
MEVMLLGHACRLLCCFSETGPATMGSSVEDDWPACSVMFGDPGWLYSAVANCSGSLCFAEIWYLLAHVYSEAQNPSPWLSISLFSRIRSGC